MALPKSQTSAPTKMHHSYTLKAGLLMGSLYCSPPLAAAVVSLISRDLPLRVTVSQKCSLIPTVLKDTQSSHLMVSGSPTTQMYLSEWKFTWIASRTAAVANKSLQEAVGHRYGPLTERNCTTATLMADSNLLFQ